MVGTPSEPGLLPRALEVIFTSFELKKLEEVRLVPERFSELRRIRDDQELEDRLRKKEKLLNLVKGSYLGFSRLSMYSESLVDVLLFCFLDKICIGMLNCD